MVSAIDPDGDELIFTVPLLPPGADLVNNLDGTAFFSWTPDLSQAGDFSLTLEVSDSSFPQESDSEEIVITILDDNCKAGKSGKSKKSCKPGKSEKSEKPKKSDKSEKKSGKAKKSSK